VALVGGHHRPADVVATADAALYDAKAGGKGRVVVRMLPASLRNGGRK
jgi:PleD family two-component response regulator